MESAGGMEPAEAAMAPASKNAKEGSRSRGRRRWRKGKAKGERAETCSSPEGTSYILRGSGDSVDWPTATRSGGVRGLAHCRLRGKRDDPL